jgi:hypothetical protein
VVQSAVVEKAQSAGTKNAWKGTLGAEPFGNSGFHTVWTRNGHTPFWQERQESTVNGHSLSVPTFTPEAYTLFI